MAHRLCFEDLALGNRWTSSSRRQVTEADVVQFADLTGDYNPLHLDEAFARQTPFRRPIAHGLLGLSLAAGIASDAPHVDTVAFLGILDWHFRRPIYFDDTLHVVTEVVRLEPSGRRRGLVTWKVELRNQQEMVVQEGLFQSLVACRNASLHAATGEAAASASTDADYQAAKN